MPSEKDALEKATCNALKIIKDAGFEISDKLRVVVDPKLPFIGYSRKRDGLNVTARAALSLSHSLLGIFFCQK